MMKSANRWMKAAMAIALGLTVSVAHGATATVDGVTWSYTVGSGKATVTGATPVEGKLAVPSSLGGYPVTGIGDEAFRGCSDLTSVVIPDSVKSIGARAFFQSRVATVAIGRGVSSIGESAFAWCPNLAQFQLDASNPNFALLDGVLLTKDRKTLVSCPCLKSGEYEIPEGVTRIGGGAFFYCDNLTSVIIPESVTEIGDVAFCTPFLNAMIIPDSVRNIGDSAFTDCGARTLVIGNHVESIGEGAFNRGCPSTAVMLPESVTNMGEWAFYMCGPQKLYVPASWKERGLWPSGVLGEEKIVYYNPETLSLGANSRLFTSAAADGKELAVKGKVAWTAKSSASWLKVKTASGKGNGTILYDVGANTGNVSRMATITVSGGEVPWTFTVVQRRFKASLELGEEVRSFTAVAAGGKELDVRATMAWTAKSSASWMAVKKGSGTGNGVVVYDVAANTGTGVRTGTITVTGNGIKRTFTVQQLGKGTTAKLELGEGARTFTADAAKNKEIGVTANVAWTAKSSALWLTAKTARGSGNGTIVYDTATNTGSGTRTGTITVEGCGLKRTFTVRQLGKGVAAVLTLGAGERSFTADAANSKELAVTANVTWTAHSPAAWLTVKAGSGRGNGVVVYDVAANAGTGARTGTITVSGGGLSRTFTVTQSGKTVTLELGASERIFTADAASGKLLAVTADVSWTAKSSASWLTVKTASGNGAGNIEYAVAANTGNKRTGTITVSGGGLTRTFTVTQEGIAARLELGASERTFTDSAAGSMGLEVMANVPWMATSSAAWLTVKTGSGTGNGGVVYDVAANTGTAARTGTITVSGGGQTRTFTVTQSGKSETQESPVGVPCRWLEENASGILAKNGGDYEAAAKSKAANGRAVWECYVAGVSVTNEIEDFKAVLALVNGKWVAKPVPDLGDAREYTVEGASEIGEGAVWGAATEGSRFFRVKVGMKKDE